MCFHLPRGLGNLGSLVNCAAMFVLHVGGHAHREGAALPEHIHADL